ncbi:RDD family protein [Nocardioides aquiterrae]|uniref:FHA domain-containing protein n=1 Tax=Nocardioides aquiterrae TaxID=203799 RepID=A0ABN1UUF8_9ACTN
MTAADLDRRFYAFAIDRLIAWTVGAVAAYLAWRYLIDRDRVVAGIAVVVAVALVEYAAFALVLGRTGGSPGNAALGIRVLDAGTGAPIGARRALVRQLVLGLATLPTFGLGTATLAWTAAMDPSGRRQGWHDRLAGSAVLDVRPVPEEPAVVDEGPPHVVNLTAMRLVPVPTTPPPPPPRSAAPVPAPPPPPAAPPPPPTPPPTPAPTPPSTPPPTPAPTPAPAPQHRAPGPEPSVPRQQLGYPLVPEPQGPAARWRVSFDSGESFLVEGLTLVGRRPEPRSGEDPGQLVALRSDDMSLSKTHAQLQVVADGVLVVMDRGSTNGTVLLRQGVARDLAAGRPTTLLDGDHVRFGDRIMSVARES